MARNSPIGRTAGEAAQGRAARSEEYRAARDEYARIDALRESDPIAAHFRERRYELGLTQQEVAEASGTSPSVISRLESGGEPPSLTTIQKLAAVLDEELAACFQGTDRGQIERALVRLGVMPRR